MKMYHASYNSFEKFDEKYINKSETDTFVNGFWFSTEKSTSCAWKNPRYLKECEINLSNPISYLDMKKLYVEKYHSMITCDEFRKELLKMGYDGVVFDEPLHLDVEKIKENCQILTDVRGNVRKFTIEEGYLTEYEVDKWGNEEYLRDYMSIENYVKENPIVVICFNSEPIEIIWEKSNEYWR